ncbi:hypothetical protein B0186_09865 [Canicola haemoglobinophilus]|uniref:Glycosyltransferase n=1 Tax=Canicola haemoglobinophilus TaxID=733 RepID=A0A1V4AZ20_9PAST|nr:glycosyltransferase family 2 protein [Canicola haemoglobinophilus]OOR98097.1 hypothetical protein B0186_09865 [Canicola haemoglobinophilus]STO59401.1 glycosyltransferase [Canicola haemoglobinophilus]
MVSVIIPIYNSMKYLRDTLDSVINQTYQDLEIILINDGSTDTSLSICKEYSKNHLRIKLFSQDNKGASMARNLGLENAQGKYILFVDSDDYILPNHIESLVTTLEKNNSDICISNCKRINENEITYNKSSKPQLDVTYTLTPEDLLKDVIYGNNIGWEVAAKLYKTSILKDIYFDDKEVLGEDFEFFYKALHRCESTSVCLNNSYFYIKKPTSITNKNDIKISEKLISIADKFSEHINANYPSLKYYSDIFMFFTYIGILGQYAINNNKSLFKQKKNSYMLWIRKLIFKILLDNKIRFKFKLKTILILANSSLYRVIQKYR